MCQFDKVFLDVGEEEEKSLENLNTGETHVIQQNYSKKTLTEDLFFEFFAVPLGMDTNQLVDASEPQFPIITSQGQLENAMIKCI